MSITWTQVQKVKKKHGKLKLKFLTNEKELRIRVEYRTVKIFRKIMYG